MTYEELKQLADEQIQYPFERVIEKWWPGADAITDHLCAGVMVIEDAFDGDGIGEEKKAALIDGAMKLWEAAPIPAVVRMFLDGILPGVLSFLIEQIVDLLNKLLTKNGTLHLGNIETADKPAITAA